MVDMTCILYVYLLWNETGTETFQNFDKKEQIQKLRALRGSVAVGS